MGHIQAVYVIVKTGSLVHAVHVSKKLFSLFLVPHIDWSFMLYVGLVHCIYLYIVFTLFCTSVGDREIYIEYTRLMVYIAQVNPSRLRKCKILRLVE